MPRPLDLRERSSAERLQSEIEAQRQLLRERVEALGAVSTPPEIARWLSEKTIYPVLLERVNAGMPGLTGEAGRQFESVAELLSGLDARLSRKLCEEILPSLKILDPACDSGAFLVAALETLAEIYGAVAAKVEPVLSPCEIRRRILRDNLFGVDLAEEAVETTRLRLRLALGESATRVEEIAPLSDLALNLFCGNSLLGLLHVDDGDFERREEGLFRRTFRQVLDEKDRQGVPRGRERQDAIATLDLILLDEWKDILYQPVKRPVSLADVTALRPFHWAYELDPVLGERGGFDVILTSPPWEAALGSVPHLQHYFRTSPQYSHPIAAAEGRKAGADLHLHEFFLARCFRLLRRGGRSGMVLPAGFYADPAAKALRETLFSHARVEALFGLSNEKSLISGIAPDFRLCLLVFARGGPTESFTAAFRTGPQDAIPADRLQEFLGEGGESGHLRWSWDLVQRLSPGSLVVPEDKRQIDLDLLEKAYRFPALGSEVAESWTLRLAREFDSTSDSYLFRTAPGPHRLPLYEARMIGPFTVDAGAPRYWLEEEEARRALLGRKADTGQPLEYQGYRLGLRDGVRGSGGGGERSLVLAMLPPGVFCGDKLPTAVPRSPDGRLDLAAALFLSAVLNSLVADYLLRQRAATSVTFSILSQLPVPRPRPETSAFSSLVELAARLTCITPDLAGLWQGAMGTFWFPEEAATDPAERERLSAELEGRVADLYGLTEEELAHVKGLPPKPWKLG
ncbi:MAG TPA: DNA methyltransferase [Thermoanaerobaculia bacterium]|nr:DNA methyltransferase [Thermoanaerobaculia bacterium]